MNSQAKNLEAIDKALHQHALRCPNPPVEIRMAPFEVERLGWDEFNGIPIVADPQMETGRVRIVCASEGEPAEETEAVATTPPQEVHA